MILVDASVIIDYCRGKDVKLSSLFPSLPLAVSGIVRSEVLAGVRSPGDRVKVVSLLDNLSQLSIRDSLWDTVGDHIALLRASGVTVPFSDITLATIALDVDCELWARDAHFPLIQTVLPKLKLFQEPP